MKKEGIIICANCKSIGGQYMHSSSFGLIIMKTNCLSPDSFNYVTGAPIYMSCEYRNYNGACKDFEAKEGENHVPSKKWHRC